MLVDLLECSSVGIQPAGDHQTATLAADMLEHMLRLRSGKPEASATGLAKMLEMFGQPHQSEGQSTWRQCCAAASRLI
jgi:hypothetical protein